MESPPESFIHRYNILLKLHYFLYFCSFGALYPIANITLRGRGLSDTEISYTNTIIPFLVFVTNPLLGFIADRSRRYKLTFCIVVTTCTILFGIMFLLPPMKTQHIKADLAYDENGKSVIDFCASQEVTSKCSSRSECGCSYRVNCTTLEEEHLSFPFSMNSASIQKQIDGHAPAVCGIQYRIPIAEQMEKKPLDRSRQVSCQITCSIPHFCYGKRLSNQMRYVIFYALLFIFGNNFLSNAIPLGASIGFASLANPEWFGRQRVFGTVGFGISAFLASRIYQIFKTDLVYLVIFATCTISCMIVTCFIRIQSKKKGKEIDELDEEKNTKKSQSGVAALIPLFQKVDVLVFLALNTVWGMSFAGLDPYLYLYIDEFATCKAHSLIGYMSLTASIAEILGFFLAVPIIKFLGTNLASISVLLAFAVRFAGYYFIRYPYFLIITETMHFFNFGILYILISQKADSIAPPGLSGTLQGVALGMSFGLGRGVALLIASFIYTMIEQRTLFLIVCIFNLIAAAIFSLYFLLTRQRDSTKIVNVKSIEDDAQNKTEPLLDTVNSNPLDRQ